MLKNASEVSVVPKKKYVFPEDLKLCAIVQSFVE
jgi:hypothetical protein